MQKNTVSSIDSHVEEIDLIELADILRGENRWTTERDVTDFPEEYRHHIPKDLARPMLDVLARKLLVKEQQVADPSRISEHRRIARAEVVVLNTLEAEMLFRFISKIAEHFGGSKVRFAKPVLLSAANV